jgi:hypothetical protein
MKSNVQEAKNKYPAPEVRKEVLNHETLSWWVSFLLVTVSFDAQLLTGSPTGLAGTLLWRIALLLLALVFCIALTRPIVGFINNEGKDLFDRNPTVATFLFLSPILVGLLIELHDKALRLMRLLGGPVVIIGTVAIVVFQSRRLWKEFTKFLPAGGGFQTRLTSASEHARIILFSIAFLLLRIMIAIVALAISSGGHSWFLYFVSLTGAVLIGLLLLEDLHCPLAPLTTSEQVKQSLQQSTTKKTVKPDASF